MAKDQSVSIIIPTLNEAGVLGELIDNLQTQGKQIEIIVVDGGSTDGTLDLLSHKANIITKPSERGRATQMNLGAQYASGNTLAFVHADTQIPSDFVQNIATITEKKWGYFKVSLSGAKLIHGVIATMMNIRCRMTSVVTGDMVLVIGKELFTKAGGFSQIPIMEDIDISKRLRRHCKPQQFNSTVTTSSRRWDKHGVYKTIILMWRLRLAYFLGARPSRLAKMYQNN